MKKPPLNISIFSDYICPFCFIGHLRLDALKKIYNLKINWCFIEIHPETVCEGQSIETLNYSREAWQQLSENLQQLATEENITLYKQAKITNSRKALLLSQAVKTLGADVFYPFHQQLFIDYFVHGKNIGDSDILKEIAMQHQIPQDIINKAWKDKYAFGPANKAPASLLPSLKYAKELQIKSVPCFVIGKHVLSGVVTREKLLNAAKNL